MNQDFRNTLNNKNTCETDIKNTLISIIVPVYNVEEYLDKCLRSLVNQTYEHIEIILIDDGSTDKSGTICDRWAEKDERIMTIHSSNQGVSHARNLGLKRAQGEFIGFVDGDDWIDSNMYHDMVTAMEKEKTDICEIGYIRENETYSYLTLVKGPAKRYSPVEALAEMFQLGDKKRFWWELCDKLFRRSLFEGLFLDEGIHASEDMLMTGQLVFRSKGFSYLPLYAYHYRMREGSATHGGLTDNQKLSSLYSHLRLWQEVKKTKKREYIDIIGDFCCIPVMRYFKNIFIRKNLSDYCTQIKEGQNLIRKFWTKSYHYDSISNKTRLGLLFFLLPYKFLIVIQKLYNKTFNKSN